MFDLLELLRQFVDLRLLGIFGVLGSFSKLQNQNLQAFPCTYPVDQLIDNQVVELFHRKIAAIANVIAFALAIRTFVIVVTATLARDNSNPMAAGAFE